MGRNIFLQYLEWHFFDALKGISAGWKNYLRFNLNYWSVPMLLKTLFSPWRRYHYSYGKGFNIKKYFEVFTFNVISRTLGAIMRSVLIIFGLIAEVFVFLAGALVVLFWLLLPFLLLFGFYFGFKILT
ncbi:MAG: hypothetical protein Q8P63_02830 [Candidatus Nealsonbacteria bacterium]|nr:hypothetical protein [Candidatus Nealsonbacteria bacterium]